MSALFKRQIANTDELRLTRRVLSRPSASVLRRWNEPGVEFALWERTWSQDLVAKLDTLSVLPRARFAARPENAEIAVELALSQSGCCDDALSRALALDIEGLITRFANATKAGEIEVRLEAICDDACRLFHVDRARARLVTTYLGPGTEWVPTHCAAEAIHNQETYGGPIHQMPRFAIGLFPGSLSPSGGLAHRSPPLKGTGRVRLFLCLTEALGGGGIVG